MNIILKEAAEITNKINFDKLKNKSVLITGASGLIGVYMISCLKMLKYTHNIQIYAWIQNDISEEFKEIFSDCHIIQSDITDLESFNHIPKFDCIIHAAGYGQPQKFLSDKIKTIKLNVPSTLELFNKLNSNGDFLFVSTSELYSGLDIENILETEIGNTNTNHVRASYIEGKRCGETICYSKMSENFNIKIARLSLAYGPGTKKHDTRVLNQLIEKALFADSINLLDSGNSIRTYCYIKDVVEMFWNILLHGKQTLYNVGGKSILTILELAQLIGTSLNKPVVTINTSTMGGSPMLVNISIDRYLSEFNKTDFVSIEDGLKNTINWQKYIYNK